MKINRDAATEPDNGDDAPESEGADPQDPQTPSGPTAADFDMSQAEELAEGSFGGETASEVDPLSAMFQGQGEVSGKFERPRNANGEAVDENGEPESRGESAEGKEQDDETEDESPESSDETPEGEAQDGEKDDESREDQREQWLDPDAFAERTGINAETPEEAAEQVNRLKDKVAGFSELGQIIQQRPGFQKVINEMADGKTFVEAAAAVEGVTTEAPDKEENPDAYAEWKAAQMQSRQQQEQELEEQQERQQEIQKKQRRMEEEFQNVVQQHDDLDAETLGTTLKRLTVTAPNARFRAQDLNTLAKGLKYDRDLEQTREEAYKRGREEALQEVRGDGRVNAGDGLPDMRSRGGASENEETHDVDADEEVTSLFAPGRADTRNIHDRV